MMKLREKCLSYVACGLAALALTACGGGGSATPPAPVAPVTGSSSGVLSDAAVQGVAYKTSSGVTGTTGADGSYSFNPGDTVEFTLGGLSLGSVTATGIVTPFELANGNAVKLSNLLVMLQSLDADGNPANGIVIPAAAAAAVTSSVNLGAATATFASSANTALKSAMTAGGISGEVKTAAAAADHFKSQGMALLSSSIWVSQSVDGEGHTQTFLLRFAPDGKYLHAETRPEDEAGHSGVEFGTVTVAGFTSLGYGLTSTVAYDDNGEWGASHLRDCDRFRSVGEQLLVGADCEDNAGTGLFSKMDNDPAGIIGAWSADASAIYSTHYLFFRNGRFLVVEFGSDYAVTGGGRYTPDSATGGGLSLVIDGGSTLPMNFSIPVGGKTMRITYDGEQLDLFRVSK